MLRRVSSREQFRATMEGLPSPFLSKEVGVQMVSQSRPARPLRYSFDWVVSAYIWLTWLLMVIIGLPIICLLIGLLPRRVLYGLARVLFRAGLAIGGVRIQVKGLEHLDRSKPYILMGNHVNLLEVFVFTAAFPVPIVGIEKKENFRIPFYGWLLKRWGQIAIDRANLDQAKKDLDRGAEVLRRGGSWLVLMPEGTRSRDGKVGPFKKGGFHLAIQTGVPIAPFVQEGGRSILSTGSWLARPGVITISILPPIDPKDYGPERLEDLLETVRDRIVGQLGLTEGEG